MEESGHYYTVYFTSLAVGFDEDIAYKHAVLAQMPDEIGALDAANEHKHECAGWSDYDLSGNKTAVETQWRFMIEYVIHSLPDKNSTNTSSSMQRSLTGKLLNKSDAASLEFGLMLHRLGDSYAHSVMGHEEVMYTVSSSGVRVECVKPSSLGHAIDGHNPDYPFLRTSLFYDYLDDLYSVLQRKYQEWHLAKEQQRLSCIQPPRSLSAIELKTIFQSVLDDSAGAVTVSRMEVQDKALQDAMITWSASSGFGPVASVIGAGAAAKMILYPNYEHTQQVFIQQIRDKCFEKLHVKMKPYSPESEGDMTLQEFLRKHPELDSMGINETKIKEALERLRSGLVSGGTL